MSEEERIEEKVPGEGAGCELRRSEFLGLPIYENMKKNRNRHP